MFPIGTGESLSNYVAKIIKMLEEKNIIYRLNPMGTTIETDNLKEALNIIYESFTCLENEVDRIYSIVKLDIRKNRKKGEMEHKVQSVIEKINE
jgi:uncharacterized protein (TIGR00106 family)